MSREVEDASSKEKQSLGNRSHYDPMDSQKRRSNMTCRSGGVVI
jgi:hypothetical protein